MRQVVKKRLKKIERKSSYSRVIQGRETIVLITQLKFKMETTRLRVTVSWYLR